MSVCVCVCQSEKKRNVADFQWYFCLEYKCKLENFPKMCSSFFGKIHFLRPTAFEAFRSFKNKKTSSLFILHNFCEMQSPTHWIKISQAKFFFQFRLMTIVPQNISPPIIYGPDCWTFFPPHHRCVHPLKEGCMQPFSTLHFIKIQKNGYPTQAKSSYYLGFGGRGLLSLYQS